MVVVMEKLSLLCSMSIGIVAYWHKDHERFFQVAQTMFCRIILKCEGSRQKCAEALFIGRGALWPFDQLLWIFIQRVRAFPKKNTPDIVFTNFTCISNQFVYKVFLKHQVRNDTLNNSLELISK